MESRPLRIRAITERSFELNEDILLLVLDMLEAIGLQRLPAWRLDCGVLHELPGWPTSKRVIGADPEGKVVYHSSAGPSTAVHMCAFAAR
jgi:hypothetical protein